MTDTRNRLKGVTSISNTTFMNALETNLKTFFDWGFLGIGAWTDVEITSPTLFGGDYSVLRRVNDPAFTAGTVYEGVRKDWAWEVDVDYDDGSSLNNPISPVSTITVNGVPTVPSYISYPLGRVIFSSAVNSAHIVRAEYSYRFVQIYKANDVPWWNSLQYRSFRVDDDHFLQTDTGDWSVGGQHRIQMPTIILECVPRTLSTGYQLGDGAHWVEQDVLCHIFAENRNDRNTIVDILCRQFDSCIWLFDIDAMADANAFPLDYRGEIVDSSLTYPALVDPNTGYRWEKCWFTNTQTAEVESLNSRLYQGVVRLTCLVALDD